jgi:hypothetical protein
MTVSRPVKILALLLLVAGVAGIASLKVLGKSSSGGSATSALSVAQIRARAHAAAKPAATPVRHATASKRATAGPKPVTKPPRPAAKPKPAAAKVPRPTTAANGLPIVLADALHAHRIVVVSVFDPQSQTDAVSYAEARAGADEARVGFVGVSVLDDTVAAPLTAALPGGGLLPLPGTLVYRAPGTLVERIDGFADRDSIAALALNARSAPALTGGPASTSTTTTPAPAAVAPAPTDTSTTP